MTMASSRRSSIKRIAWMFRLTATFYALLTAVEVTAESGQGQNSFPYLYASRSNHNASFPVIEYFAPTGRKQLENDKPAFLYGDKQGYRIVEFYGHWCNTCKNFKPHYVHFAQRIQQIAKQQNISVSVYAVSCHPNRKLCRKQTTQGYPIVRLLKPGATEGIDIKHTDVNPITCLQKLGLNFVETEEAANWDAPVMLDSEKASHWDRMVDSIFGKQPIDAINAPSFRRRTREEMKNDIHLSFDFAMRDGVFTSDEPLSEKAAKALKEWLKLLQKTLPKAWEMQHLLDQLLRDHNYITKHEAYMVGILDQYIPAKPLWSDSCSKGDPDAGYTCGLWELFHAMTIGLVEHNVMNHELKRISTDDAAHTLRDYIKHFFGCIECRNNFLAMYDSCAHDRCKRLVNDANGLVKEKHTSWAQLPLWLFEAHNAVNVRLMKEKAERNKQTPSKQNELDVLWPSRQECFACYSDNMKDDVVEWNKTNVYKWLSLEYGHRDAASVEIRKELMVLAANSDEAKKRKKTRLQIANASAIMAFLMVFVLGVKVRNRRVTGQHKKHERDLGKTSVHKKKDDSLLSSPLKKRGTLNKASILDRIQRTA